MANHAPYFTLDATTWWANLAQALTISQGHRPGAARITEGTLRLEVLMRTLTKEQRAPILQTVGVSEHTWWMWCRNPRKLPGQALVMVLAVAKETHERELDPSEVYEPINYRPHGNAA